MFRDESSFQPTIEAAADRLGISAIAVEKDYWVSQVLRVLAEQHLDDFVFKGGTSLSKGYALIERFSDDIDLLIVKGTRGAGAIDRLMKDMGATVGDSLRSTPVSIRSGRGKHRTYRVGYPTSRGGTTSLEATVLLEMGVRGGAQPSQNVVIGMLLSDVLADGDIDLSKFQDLQQFSVNVLHPGRTLLEKLYVVHAEARRLSRDSTASVTPRTGRHFYDISQLLADGEVAVFLSDSDQTAAAFDEIEEISREYFATEEGQELRPEGGFRSSPAFDPSLDVSIRLQAVYESDMEELYFGSTPLPTWGEICEQVASMGV
ncbi:MAG: nucleotidyl transferase AbiEii/AbiGii toxin family protein [Acidimicrobiia bacterium]|nr:MAG: nucleotidyl transferase AbiEii/AbiGii toxin family protein [Acidimicrobiia bacterium]